jgi:hypothetical protein
MQVANCTTPAQYFHVLRRQMHRPFRKPLVVMTPKSLLRHSRAVSAIEDFTDGAFRTVMPDPDAPDPAGVHRLLLCSGKIFYALQQARAERGWGGIAIVRVEQLYPFPAAELRLAVAAYPGATDVRWVQEEPQNQGAWSSVFWRIEQLLGGRVLRYVGRSEAASPATGSHKAHQSEEEAILETALKRPRRSTPVGSGDDDGGSISSGGDASGGGSHQGSASDVAAPGSPGAAAAGPRTGAADGGDARTGLPDGVETRNSGVDGDDMRTSAAHRDDPRIGPAGGADTRAGAADVDDTQSAAADGARTASAAGDPSGA